MYLRAHDTFVTHIMKPATATGHRSMRLCARKQRPQLAWRCHTGNQCWDLLVFAPSRAQARQRAAEGILARLPYPDWSPPGFHPYNTWRAIRAPEFDCYSGQVKARVISSQSELPEDAPQFFFELKNVEEI
jgi:hypothetical protein